MGDKIKLTLADLRKTKFDGDFEVTQVQNCADYTIGEYLSINQVRDLCNIRDFDVVIKPPKK